MSEPDRRQTYPRVERRQRPDIWVRSLEWLVVVSWMLLLLALMVLSKAKPQVETFFERYYQLPLDSTWNLELLFYLRLLMGVGLFLSSAGLVINWRRSRRAGDEYRISLLILGGISLFGLLFPSLIQ
ncbi:hypothetical protein [Geoalkalibacter sp.]|uniref:hypothetical protein n=1 Tax=Geoalkalibacter sp. TaxID=3041440 RepID=UPI00272E5C90|nr:hypothetical protein [Geoalkalibacter sp.]